MEIISTIAEMQNRSADIRKSQKTIGLVPTMGYLHAGHMALVEESVSKCDLTVVSIFVNPAQFGPNEDLGTYPSDLKNDRRQLESAGVDVLFLPDRHSMYPSGYKTYVRVDEITNHLCGRSRPGFFKGVCTVVLKLFNITRPHMAFFGEKDWQQLAVVETMVRDLNLDINIIRLPLVREFDGLAMSSRNRYLSEQERAPALTLSQALENARRQVENGEYSASKLREGIRDTIESRNGTEVDYISICDPESFLEQEEIQDKTLIALAVRVGKARLIDNCVVRRTKCNESC